MDSYQKKIRIFKDHFLFPFVSSAGEVEISATMTNTHIPGGRGRQQQQKRVGGKKNSFIPFDEKKRIAPFQICTQGSQNGKKDGVKLKKLLVNLCVLREQELKVFCNEQRWLVHFFKKKNKNRGRVGILALKPSFMHRKNPKRIYSAKGVYVGKGRN